MGKKKASRSRKLRPILEQAIRDDLIFVRPKDPKYYASFEGQAERRKVGRQYESYEVCLGSDNRWYDFSDPNFIPLMVFVFPNGKINWQFGRPLDHVLDRNNATWFSEQLEEIIVMAKLGCYDSQERPTNSSIDSAAQIWRWDGAEKRKKENKL